MEVFKCFAWLYAHMTGKDSLFQTSSPFQANYKHSIAYSAHTLSVHDNESPYVKHTLSEDGAASFGSRQAIAEITQSRSQNWDR